MLFFHAVIVISQSPAVLFSESIVTLISRSSCEIVVHRKYVGE